MPEETAIVAPKRRINKKAVDPVNLIPKRRDLMDGFVLAPTGAMLGDAICAADISIPQYRQSLERSGNVILSRYTSNDHAREFMGEPPDLDTCQAVIDAVNERKPGIVEALTDELEQLRVDLTLDLSRGDRSFAQGRARQMEKKLAAIQSEKVTAQELYRAFLAEDVALRSAGVPPEMRQALDTIQRERELALA